MVDRKLFFLVNAFILSLVFSGVRYLQDASVVPQGPLLNIAEVTKSLWYSGSLRPERFEQVYRAAQELSRTNKSEVWQDVFALDIRGELAPKHSLLSSIIAVPFYGVFGDAGFWVLQQVLLMWLLYSTYSIATRIIGRSLPLTTIAVTCFLSPILLHSCSFSYDLHGCAFLIGGLNTMHRRPFLGAFLMSLSTLVRPSNFLIVAPLLCAVCQQIPQWGRTVLIRCAGVAVGLSLFLAVNYLLWGSPFTTAYGRLLGFRNGEPFISPHPVGGDLDTFMSDWSMKLWGQKGMLPYTPCLMLLPFVILSLHRQREWRFQAVCLFAAVLYTLYVFSYQMWMVTEQGNRFLLGATFLIIPSCIAFLARIIPEARTESSLSLGRDLNSP